VVTSFRCAGAAEVTAMTTQYWITGASGDCSDAAGWVSGAVPGPTDDVVITGSSATVDATAAAYSLTLDSSCWGVSSALTLGTSLTLIDGARPALRGGNAVGAIDLIH